MRRYAVVLCHVEPNVSLTFWVEFYWAEDQDHAVEQAKDANPKDDVVCCGYDLYSQAANVTDPK